MKDIKKIYVCGGSQCIGAGFIWKDVKKIYKEQHNIDINNHLDFAYPNILAKKLGVDIINEGAPGGSVTRMLRKTYDYLLENYSTIKETLVILEIPPGWREELNSIDLGRTINMTVGNILSPEKIILAGGITKAGSILTDPLEKLINEYEWRIGENRMQIEIAHFGEQSGAIGAAAFSFLENKNNS
jgi:hypothetical protein